MTKLSSIFTATLAICLSAMSNLAYSTTVLTFQVSADRQVASYDGGLQWLSTGSETFTFTVTLDGSQYSVDNTIPPGYESLVESSQIGLVPSTAIAGASADEIADFRANSQVSPAAVHQAAGKAELAESQTLGNLQTLAFRDSLTESRQIGETTVQNNGFESVRQYSYQETLSISHNIDASLAVADISDFDGFIDLVLSLEGVSDAFRFNHQVLETDDICVPNFQLCESELLGTPPAYSSDGLRYVGNATLVSVSEVPLPASVWLFASALGGLALRRARPTA